MIVAKNTVLLGVQHADVGQRRVEELLRPADGEAAPIGLPAAVHVAVLDPPPLMRVAAFLQHAASRVHLGAAEVGRNVERVRQPVEPRAGLPLQVVGQVFGQIGVGALVVAVDLHRALGHLVLSSSR
jgi:hypothetical protein